MAEKTYVHPDGRTRLIDTRDAAAVVRAEFAGWVEQKPAKSTEKTTTKPADTKT